jgi:hypothetical protein
VLAGGRCRKEKKKRLDIFVDLFSFLKKIRRAGEAGDDRFAGRRFWERSGLGAGPGQNADGELSRPLLVGGECSGVHCCGAAARALLAGQCGGRQTGGCRRSYRNGGGQLSSEG